MSGLPPMYQVPVIWPLAKSMVEDRPGDAVGDVEALGVAADRHAVRPLPGRQEADLAHRHRIDHRDAVPTLVGDVENRTVGRELYIHRQAAECTRPMTDIVTVSTLITCPSNSQLTSR